MRDIFQVHLIHHLSVIQFFDILILGSALFEYRDVLPIKATYAWYKTFGEPHTIKQLYSNIYTLEKKRRAGSGHYVLSLPNIRIGRNVINCGNKILYFEGMSSIF